MSRLYLMASNNCRGSPDPRVITMNKLNDSVVLPLAQEATDGIARITDKSSYVREVAKGAAEDSEMNHSRPLTASRRSIVAVSFLSVLSLESRRRARCSTTHHAFFIFPIL